MSFKDYLLCVTGEHRVKRDTAVQYGPELDPCRSYIRLTEPERHVTNHVTFLTHSTLCDRKLKRRWYRFDGGAMPGQCVSEFSCGTHAPVWLNGVHPSTYGETKDIEACVSLGGHCCVNRWYVKVANCGTFYSYLLSDTPGCYMAYCSGTVEPCSEGQSSPTGTTPGCSRDYPPLDGSVVLRHGSQGHKLAFYCDYDGTIPPGSSLQVDWFVQADDDGFDDPYAVWQDNMRERRRSVLTEGRWQRKMGSYISCEIRSKWQNGTGVPGPVIKSNSFFAGIKVLTSAIEVSESDPAAYIQIQSTLPILCLPLFKQACALHIELAQSDDYLAKRCVDGAVRQVVLGDCSVTITPDNWQEVHNVSVKAVRDFYSDGTRRMRVAFRPIISTTVTRIWNNYKLPDVEVVARDVDTQMCSSTGDPHITTFDQLYYKVLLEGEFVLYRNMRLPYQINTRLQRCGDDVTCNCGVAVRAEDDVIVIDRCRRRGQRSPDEWQSLHKHALEQGDHFTSGLKIYEYDEGRKYTIHLPTGAYIDFELGENWVNLYLHASPEDYRWSIGLCGTFDGTWRNDLTFRDGQTQAYAYEGASCGGDQDVCDFVESWRVTSNDTTLFGYGIDIPQNDDAMVSDPGKYCRCEELPSGDTHVLCSLQYDIDNCQEREEQVTGKDVTSDILIGRRHTRDVFNDVTENDEYFSSEFVYDSSFMGKAPQWPTPSGLTQSVVRQHCIEFLLKSDAGKICTSLIADRLNSIIAACSIDIQAADSLDWAQASLSSVTSECMQRVHQNHALWLAEDYDVTMPNVTSSRGRSMTSLLCPGGCSRRGECRQGRCYCQPEFSGVACSVKVEQNITLSHIVGGGLCDIAYHPCAHVTLFGNGFTKNMSCIFAQEHTNSTMEVIANFISFDQVTCALKADHSTHHLPFLVSLTNDNVTSQQIPFVIFDSTCQNCSRQEGLVLCKQKPDTCFVDGHCYIPSHAPSDECCKTCQPNISTDTLTARSDNNPPRLSTLTTHHIMFDHQSWELNLTASDPEGCGVKVHMNGPETPWLNWRVSDESARITLSGSPPGQYTMKIRATDTCGAHTNHTLTVVVLRGPVSTAGTVTNHKEKQRTHERKFGLDEISKISSSPPSEEVFVKNRTFECYDNRPPLFPASELNVTLVHGERVSVPLHAEDPEGGELSYFTIQKSHSRVSVTHTGHLRYVGSHHNHTETIKVIAEDECQAKAHLSVHIHTVQCPCVNGHCVPQIHQSPGRGLYDCVCQDGFTGKLCQFAYKL